MKLNAKQQSKLDKCFALYNDSAAKTTEESEAAKEALKRLCEAYKVDFDAFMRSKQQSVNTDASDASTDASASVKNYMKSRRAFIIEKLQSCLYDKETLAHEIALFFAQYKDVKRNKTAISGTIYDLTTNDKATCKTCEDSRLIFKLKRKK